MRMCGAQGALLTTASTTGNRAAEVASDETVGRGRQVRLCRMLDPQRADALILAVGMFQACVWFQRLECKHI